VTIRIGVIGAGIMGTDHAKILATQIPGVTLQYICDADIARSKAVAESVGARHSSSDPMAVIARKSRAPLLPAQDRSKLIEQRGAFCGEAAI